MTDHRQPGLPAATSRQAIWRRSLLLLGCVLLALLLAYRDTLSTMVGVWTRSDTFAHGFLVLPISLYLIWQRRQRLAALRPQPSPACMLALLLCGFVWLLGDLARTNALAQFAAVGSLILAVASVLGSRLAGQMAFPLGFLLFAVPFGEFVIPTFMHWTAEVTVRGLRLSGVPVYREGLEFIIPSGRWSVVEACSGVRYLIASLMVGTLFAYLSYVSLRRRLIFIAAAIVVPVLANWLRAYLIVMLGHWSGNRLAVGVDHLIYGWLFFGLVIIALFWVGSRWQQAPAQPDPLPVPETQARSWPWAGQLAAILLLGLSWPALAWWLEQADPRPVALPAWTAEGNWRPVATFDDWQPSLEAPAVLQTAQFSLGGEPVGTVLAYYRQQREGSKVASSRSVLVRSNDSERELLAQQALNVTVGGQTVPLQAAELRKADGQRLLVWQAYWVGGRWTASPALARAYTAWSRLRGQGDDTAVLLVYTAHGDDASARLQGFLSDHWRGLQARLQQARAAS